MQSVRQTVFKISELDLFRYVHVQTNLIFKTHYNSRCLTRYLAHPSSNSGVNYERTWKLDIAEVRKKNHSELESDKSQQFGYMISMMSKEVYDIIMSLTSDVNAMIGRNPMEVATIIATSITPPVSDIIMS